jgi:hypothetical protein
MLALTFPNIVTVSLISLAAWAAAKYLSGVTGVGADYL